MDAKIFLHRVRQIEAEFGNVRSVFITSTELQEDSGGKAGVVCEATPELAARRIAAKSARPSRPEEIQQFRQDQETRSAAYAQSELGNQKSSGAVNLLVTQMAQMTAALAAGAQSAAVGGKQRGQEKG